MKPIVRSIAETIQIDTEWREIHPDPPLEVSRQIQRISIDVPSVADWDLRPESASFLMPDGTSIKVEVELIAADGGRFVLDSVGLGPGLTFSRLPPEAGDVGSRFPEDMKFTTVRVRSDKPLQGGRITWICITNY